MPFDATEFPRDGAPAEPAAVPLWLRCFIFAMIFALVMMAMRVGWKIADYIGTL
jgi:hypothetical protein